MSVIISVVSLQQEKMLLAANGLFHNTYRIYPKYSDTVNVRTPSFFLKRHLFYVPYISRHVPNMVFLLSVNVRTQKICLLFLIKFLIFTTGILCIFALVYLCFRLV